MQDKENSINFEDMAQAFSKPSNNDLPEELNLDNLSSDYYGETQNEEFDFSNDIEEPNQETLNNENLNIKNEDFGNESFFSNDNMDEVSIDNQKNEQINEPNHSFETNQDPNQENKEPNWNEYDYLHNQGKDNGVKFAQKELSDKERLIKGYGLFNDEMIKAIKGNKYGASPALRQLARCYSNKVAINQMTDGKSGYSQANIRECFDKYYKDSAESVKKWRNDFYQSASATAMMGPVFMFAFIALIAKETFEKNKQVNFMIADEKRHRNLMDFLLMDKNEQLERLKEGNEKIKGYSESFEPLNEFVKKQEEDIKNVLDSIANTESGGKYDNIKDFIKNDVLSENIDKESKERIINKEEKEIAIEKSKIEKKVPDTEKSDKLFSKNYFRSYFLDNKDYDYGDYKLVFNDDTNKFDLKKYDDSGNLVIEEAGYSDRTKNFVRGITSSLTAIGNKEGAFSLIDTNYSEAIKELKKSSFDKIFNDSVDNKFNTRDKETKDSLKNETLFELTKTAFQSAIKNSYLKIETGKIAGKKNSIKNDEKAVVLLEEEINDIHTKFLETGVLESEEKYKDKIISSLYSFGLYSKDRLESVAGETAKKIYEEHSKIQQDVLDNLARKSNHDNKLYELDTKELFVKQALKNSEFKLEKIKSESFTKADKMTFDIADRLSEIFENKGFRKSVNVLSAMANDTIEELTSAKNIQKANDTIVNKVINSDNISKKEKSKVKEAIYGAINEFHTNFAKSGEYDFDGLKRNLTNSLDFNGELKNNLPNYILDSIENEIVVENNSDYFCKKRNELANALRTKNELDYIKENILYSTAISPERDKLIENTKQMREKLEGLAFRNINISAKEITDEIMLEYKKQPSYSEENIDEIKNMVGGQVYSVLHNKLNNFAKNREKLDEEKLVDSIFNEIKTRVGQEDVKKSFDNVEIEKLTKTNILKRIEGMKFLKENIDTNQQRLKKYANINYYEEMCNIIKSPKADIFSNIITLKSGDVGLSKNFINFLTGDKVSFKGLFGKSSIDENFFKIIPAKLNLLATHFSKESDLTIGLRNNMPNTNIRKAPKELDLSKINQEINLEIEKETPNLKVKAEDIANKELIKKAEEKIKNVIDIANLNDEQKISEMLKQDIYEKHINEILEKENPKLSEISTEERAKLVKQKEESLLKDIKENNYLNNYLKSRIKDFDKLTEEEQNIRLKKEYKLANLDNSETRQKQLNKMGKMTKNENEFLHSTALSQLKNKIFDNFLQSKISDSERSSGKSMEVLKAETLLKISQEEKKIFFENAMDMLKQAFRENMQKDKITDHKLDFIMGKTLTPKDSFAKVLSYIVDGKLKQVVYSHNFNKNHELDNERPLAMFRASGKSLEEGMKFLTNPKNSSWIPIKGKLTHKIASAIKEGNQILNTLRGASSKTSSVDFATVIEQTKNIIDNKMDNLFREQLYNKVGVKRFENISDEIINQIRQLKRIDKNILKDDVLLGVAKQILSKPGGLSQIIKNSSTLKMKALDEIFIKETERKESYYKDTLEKENLFTILKEKKRFKEIKEKIKEEIKEVKDSFIATDVSKNILSKRKISL